MAELWRPVGDGEQAIDSTIYYQLLLLVLVAELGSKFQSLNVSFCNRFNSPIVDRNGRF